MLVHCTHLHIQNANYLVTMKIIRCLYHNGAKEACTENRLTGYIVLRVLVRGTADLWVCAVLLLAQRQQARCQARGDTQTHNKPTY